MMSKGAGERTMHIHKHIDCLVSGYRESPYWLNSHFPDNFGVILLASTLLRGLFYTISTSELEIRAHMK